MVDAAPSSQDTLDQEFQQWSRRASHFLRTSPQKLPLGHIFQWLPLRDLVRLQQCSHYFRTLMKHCQRWTSPQHVVDEIDSLVAAGRVVLAEQLLRDFVAVMPNVPTPIRILNRYLLLAHSDVFGEDGTPQHRAEVFEHFKGKALEEVRAYYGNKSHPSPPLVALIANLEFTGTTPSYGHPTLSMAPAIVQSIYARVEAAMKPDGGLAHQKSKERLRHASNTAVKFDRAHDRRIRGDAIYLLAYFCYKDAQPAAAQSILKEGRSHFPSAPMLEWLSGVIGHYISQDLQESAHAYTKAIEQTPDFAYALYSLGVLLYDAGAVEKSLLLYSKCLELDPNHHFALMNRAMPSLGTDPAALQELRRAMKIHPTEISVYRWVAAHLAEEGPQFVPQALQLLEQATKIAPSNYEVHFVFGQIYLRQNNYDASLEHLIKYVVVGGDRIERRRRNSIVEIISELELALGREPGQYAVAEQ